MYKIIWCKNDKCWFKKAKIGVKCKNFGVKKAKILV